MPFEQRCDFVDLRKGICVWGIVLLFCYQVKRDFLPQVRGAGQPLAEVRSAPCWCKAA
jgi:uncharacterized membrane protein YcfT